MISGRARSSKRIDAGLEMLQDPSLRGPVFQAPDALLIQVAARRTPIARVSPVAAPLPLVRNASAAPTLPAFLGSGGVADLAGASFQLVLLGCERPSLERSEA